MGEFNWQQTVAQAAKGDKNAFEMLYKQTERSVYFTCLKLLGNEHDAMDIMQDTYIKAFEKLSELSDYSKFQDWINRIAINRCKTFFRKTTTDYLEDNVEQAEDIVDESEIIPSDYVSDAEKRHIIMNIIDTQLSDVQRQTVILYYYDEMSVAQIAEIMECPEGTVKYRLSAAREKIREAVLIYEKENDDRLHAIMPIPVLTSILRKEAEEIAVPKIQLFKPEASSPKQGTGNNSNSNMKGQNTMTSAIKGKIIAGVAAAVIVIGGGITAAVVLNSDKPDKSDDTSVSRTDKDKNSSIIEIDNSTSDDNSMDIPSADNSRDDDPSESDSSKRPSKKDGDYPEFDGLEVVKFGKITENYYSPDVDLLSGTIKDMYVNEWHYVLIDNNGVIYLCQRESKGAYINELGRDTGIEHFDCVGFDLSADRCSFTVIDGNNIYYKAIKEAISGEGVTRLEKKTSIPLEFKGTIMDGKKLRDINLDYNSYRIYILDEGSEFYLGSQWYYDDEAGVLRDGDVFLDSAGIYVDDYATRRSAVIEPEGEKIVQFADRCILTASGKIYYHDYGKTLFDEEPLTSAADLRISKIFGCDSRRFIDYISILTEDNKIVTIDSGSDELLFEANAPGGNVLDIHTTDERIIVQTDTGYYYADIEDGEFAPLDTLNNLSEEVVRLYADKVLLSNGYIYDIIFDD